MEKVIIVILVYIGIGSIYATHWAVVYDPSINSAPNNSISFIINTLTWPSSILSLFHNTK